MKTLIYAFFLIDCSAVKIIVATAIEKICRIWTHHRPEVQY